MTAVGVLGSGMIGAAVARLAVAAGHEVAIANSRGPQSLAEFVDGLGGRARAGDVGDVVAGADVVVLAVPLATYPQFPVGAFAGATLVDTTNYYPERFGRLPDLEASGLPSSAFLQQRWPGARLVKGLNTMDFVRLEVLARAPGGVRTAVPLAADLEAPAAVVADFLASLGFDPLDAGGLGSSWRFQPGTPLHVQAYLRFPEGVADEAERFARAESVPVTVPETQALLDAAR